jgi:PD-(D/E)XK endonuclease
MSGDRSRRRSHSASSRKTVRPGPRSGAHPSPRTPRQVSAALERELTTKRRGELAELAFALKAASLGFGVSRPWGDSERYDFILDADDLHPAPPRRASSPAGAAVARESDLAAPCDAARSLRGNNPRSALTHCSPPSRLARVQVKGSTQIINGLYHVNSCRHVNGRAVPYTAAEIDFFAAYVIPEDTWYILPVHEVASRTSLLFRRKRDRKPGQFDTYNEAWRLLRQI